MFVIFEKNGVDFFDNGEVTASLRYAFHTKNILFSKNCHVAVSGSKVTNDPSKCSQERGLLPYYHNLFVMFVIFEKNGVHFFDNGEVTASLRYAFHTKNILFLKNCHVAVSGSKVTNDPSKCSQERGLLPYYHNLFVMFVIFEKNGDFGKKTAKTAFFIVDLGTLAKFSIYLIISPLEPKKKFQLQENSKFLNRDFSTH